MRDKKSPCGTFYKGRGTSISPQGRYEMLTREVMVDDYQAEADIFSEKIPETTVHWDKTNRLLTTNNSPDIPHGLSVNPYRGCEHGCIYCFARPTHAYLGLSAGLDFETQIYAKANAAQLLRQALAKPQYYPQVLSLGVITDAYQPLERQLCITKQLLDILAECNHPVSLITKSALIERDISLLSDMAKHDLVEVAISITTLDNTLSRRLEPRAAAPARRLKIIERLAQAGIPTTVLMAPIIPAINDSEIETLLSAAANAGAISAGYVVLRLPHELKQIFPHWLKTHMPLRAEKVMQQVRSLHDGKDYNPIFYKRHTGSGVYAQLIASRFKKACNRYDLQRSRSRKLRTNLFRAPNNGQLNLL